MTHSQERPRTRGPPRRPPFPHPGLIALSGAVPAAPGHGDGRCLGAHGPPREDRPLGLASRPPPFPHRFMQHPKNFGLIASFLERKVSWCLAGGWRPLQAQGGGPPCPLRERLCRPRLARDGEGHQAASHLGNPGGPGGRPTALRPAPHQLLECRQVSLQIGGVAPQPCCAGVPSKTCGRAVCLPEPGRGGRLGLDVVTAALWCPHGSPGLWLAFSVPWTSLLWS